TEQQKQQFNKVYTQLNNEQKIAVDAIEGPVMVIAGPGTGKTQILSARIGKILLETDTQPENILCLTYTDAGTLAMRKRLMNFIGPDAYKVHIHTFHSFCNDVIQNNLSYFDKNNLDPLSDLEKSAFLKKLIDGFKKDNPLKRYRGDIYFDAGRIFSVFQVMKKEGFTPDFMQQKIDAYIESLPLREEYIYKKKTKNANAGDLKQAAIDEETDKMIRLKAAVAAYPVFQQIMDKEERYDFDDMILWVLRAFKNNENLLRKYQEQYLYVLVDEYQDTSGTQNNLVQLLISYWDAPNVFVVGDDDQSIYRFQGANVENMLGFAKHYEDEIMKIVLTQNYRSTQPILDVAKTIIEKNNERLINQIPGLTKNLIAANTNINSITYFPKIIAYNTTHDEMIGVTLAVKNLVENGVAAGAIGIIYKENKYGQTLTQYFKKLQIPVYSKRHENLFTIPFGDKLIKLLQYLYLEHDTPFGGEELLFEILHFDFWKIPAIEVAKLTVEVAARNYKNKTTLRELMAEKSAQQPRDLFSVSIHPALKNASEQLEALIQAVPNATLQQLMDNIIQKCGVLSSMMNSPEKMWQMQVLTALFDFIKDETRRNPYMHLKGLMENFDLMKASNLPLPLVQVNGTDKGVNLLTAHGSKGLEFKHVFVVGSEADVWEKKRKNNSDFKYPDNLFDAANKADDLEELRRLFYVAITRAETDLQISYKLQDDKGKGKEPSMFVAEIQAEHGITTEAVEIDEAVKFDFNMLQLSAQKPEISKEEQDFITPILDKFVMNVTALNNYLNCPLAFYYRNLIRIPSGKNEATEFGSAVHEALEKLFKKMQENPDNIFPPKEVFVKDFEMYLVRNRECFTQEQFARRLEQGQIILPAYYDKYIHQFNKVVTVERMINGVVVEGVPLRGKIDKLEFDGKMVNVVDYKSGDYDKAKSGKRSFDLPNEKTPNGGDYWRQAVFYKILLDNYTQKDWQVISTEFDFIEPDKKNEYHKEKVVITPEDVTTVKHQIKTVWAKIQQHEFYIGCGKEDCRYCNFVKNNNLAVALHDEEEEY
ncbi:MAG: ATP-dependent helicase, partial [Pedobacter sp.]|nr:ATP-dependent helicase [Chitinophagaceae bacterium]